jgi:hypothetical protein
MIVDTQLYSCGLDTAPDRFDSSCKSVNSQADRLFLVNKSKGLQSVGNIHINYSSIDVSKLPTKRQYGLFGSRYYNLTFEIQVKFGSKSGSLGVQALCGGILTGSADIVYD